LKLIDQSPPQDFYMNWPRKLGVFLVASGALLLGVYLVPTVYGGAMSHLAIAQFRSQGSANSLWDSSRIRAYQRTLALAFPPPEAILRVRRLGIEVPVLEGTSDATLNRGVGHISGTALPGQPGNLAITGHRDGFFRPLKDVVPGDIIEVQRAGLGRPAQESSQAGGTNPPAPQIDRYVVRNTKIVLPSDTSVLGQTAGSTLTLVTCYPFYFVGAAPERYIVQASLLPAPQAAAMQGDPMHLGDKPGATSSVQPISGE
jgi:sortase A